MAGLVLSSFLRNFCLDIVDALAQHFFHIVATLNLISDHGLHVPHISLLLLKQFLEPRSEVLIPLKFWVLGKSC